MKILQSIDIFPVLLTLAAAVIMRRLGERFPRLNQWTIGVYRKK